MIRSAVLTNHYAAGGRARRAAGIGGCGRAGQLDGRRRGVHIRQTDGKEWRYTLLHGDLVPVPAAGPLGDRLRVQRSTPPADARGEHHPLLHHPETIAWNWPSCGLPGWEAIRCRHRGHRRRSRWSQRPAPAGRQPATRRRRADRPGRNHSGHDFGRQPRADGTGPVGEEDPRPAGGGVEDLRAPLPRPLRAGGGRALADRSGGVRLREVAGRVSQPGAPQAAGPAGDRIHQQIPVDAGETPHGRHLRPAVFAHLDPQRGPRA